MKKILIRLSQSVLFVFLTLSVFSLPVCGQDLDEVTITGRVVDTNNAPIPGALVAATLDATGLQRTAITNGDGRYRLIELPPGTYDLKASMQGFADRGKNGLAAIAGQNLRLDFVLAPAGVAAEQIVRADEEETAVDLTRTVVGGTLAERELEDLPNGARNPLDLVLLLGGVTEEPLSTRDLASDRGQRGIAAPGATPEEAGIFALSGGAAYSNNITIDGFDNNDDRTASFRFQPSLESIAEVQVITNQFSAEYGRASGGRVNLRTRTGSNRFRGRAFYFFRDDDLNANTWNNNRRGVARPPFTNHDSGFSLGGPVVKSRLFFFAAYEYDYNREDTLLDIWVPLAYTNTRLSLPLPTNPERAVTVTSGGQSVQVAPYIAPLETPLKRHALSARGDWNLNSLHNFSFGYQLGRSIDLRAFSGTNRLADSLIGRVRNTDAFNAAHNHVVSSRAVNQLRFQYSRLRPSSAQSAGEFFPAVLVTFTPPGESSQTQVYGSTSSSSRREEDRWQFQDTLNIVAGKHTLKAGVDFQRVNSIFISRFDGTGTYSFSNFVLFQNNSVSRLQQNFNTTSEIKNTYYGLFVQDEWRALPNLTISLGLRYEAESVIDDDNNIGPRLAAAWNPFRASSKTVVRFGAGIFYNRVLLRTVDDFTSGTRQLRFDSSSLRVPEGVAVDASVIRQFLSAHFPNPLTLDTIVPVNQTASFAVRELARSPQVFRSLSPDLRIPESYQLNLGFERELIKGIVFQANLTYNKTVRLWREYNPNAPRLPSGTPDRDGSGTVTFTDYLLGITNGNSLFELGSPADTVGLRSPAGGACTSGSQLCIVNLNARNNSSNCSATTVTNTPICRAFAAINELRPHLAEAGAVQLEQVISAGSSAYRGLSLELRSRHKRFGAGFGGSMRLVYTLSSLKDDGIVNTSEATIPGSFTREWSRSLLDRRHRLAFSGSFDLPAPFGKLRLSPVFRFGSGAPFNVSIGGHDRNLDDISNDRPDFRGNPKEIKWRKYGTAFPQQLAERFSLAPIGSPGSLPRNAGRGPRLYILDLNVGRQFRFGERLRLRPSAEFGNVLNMTVFSFGSNFINFDLLNSTNAATVASAREAFLSPTRTVRPRQIRLGLRLDF